MRAYTDNRRSEVTGDWPALTTALSPRIERPERCARRAPLNQPTAPSPRPSPPPRGRGCPKGGRGGGSWAGRAVPSGWEVIPLSMVEVSSHEPGGARLHRALTKFLSKLPLRGEETLRVSAADGSELFLA